MTTERELEEFYIAFAKAFLGWQHVEDVIFEFFAELFKGTNPDSLSAAFHAVITFDGRLAMVDEAFRVRVKDPMIVGEWKQLHKKIRKKATSRNTLAHLSLTYVADSVKLGR